MNVLDAGLAKGAASLLIVGAPDGKPALRVPLAAPMAAHVAGQARGGGL